MIRYIENFVIIFLLLWIAICFATPINCLAHGTGFRVLDDYYTVSVEFYYTGGEPMSFSNVLLFSPGNHDIEYQNGRTDKNGRFSFNPNVQGSWVIKASDGRGHKVNARIGVENLENMPHVKTEMIPNYSGHKPLAIALGLSIIFNVFGSIALIRGKVKKERNDLR